MEKKDSNGTDTVEQQEQRTVKPSFDIYGCINSSACCEANFCSAEPVAADHFDKMDVHKISTNELSETDNIHSILNDRNTTIDFVHLVDDSDKLSDNDDKASEQSEIVHNLKGIGADFPLDEIEHIKLYTRTECESLGGIWHANGECTKVEGGSYSWDNRKQPYTVKIKLRDSTIEYYEVLQVEVYRGQNRLF